MHTSYEYVLTRNPAYGNGVYRRRILIRSVPDGVDVKLEDGSHAMWLELRHAKGVITALEGKIVRGPITTCASAHEKLTDFIGQALKPGYSAYVKDIRPKSHCTHLYDLTILAINHALEDRPQRQIDLEIDDEKDGILRARAYMDGHCLHQWEIVDKKVLSPSHLQGKPLFSGFIAWVMEEFEGDALACALNLQKGVLVSGARRWDLDAAAGTRADVFGPGIDVCYSLATERIQQGFRNSNPLRDFTHTPEELLKFR